MAQGSIAPAAPSSQVPARREAEGQSRRRRRRQLIDATITSISEHGLSRTTLAKVAKIAGLSPGIVNFYFTSKDALLVATLRELAEEFETALESAVAEAGENPAAALDAVIDAYFEPAISDPRKVAVWYAFWSESRARADYLKLCGHQDAAFFEQILALCRKIIGRGNHPHLDAEALARGFIGIVDGLWQDILKDPDDYDREAAKAKCRAYLKSVFPSEFEGRPVAKATAMPEAAGKEPRAERDGPPLTLPAWTYDNAEFFALEREHIFVPSWQLVCHVSEIPDPGDYATLNLMNERAFVVRSEDGTLRAFHNVCRHRAHAVVTGASGHCPKMISCPYHGWTYNLDGALKAVPKEKTFPGLDKRDFGLKPIELEVFLGFVFIRFEGVGPGVAELMAPYRQELEPYRIEDMRPVGREWSMDIDVDWKTVMDNFLEGYHIPTGHPGLFRLFGNDYQVEARESGVSRAYSSMREKPSRNWSGRHYQKLLPVAEHLPEDRRRAWVYYGLFPNTAFDIYPEMMDFFQVIPMGPGRSKLRARGYGHADSRREMRATRYLNWRINNRVQDEDSSIVASVQSGLASRSYSRGVFSEIEICVSRQHEKIRAILPVAELAEAPELGEVARLNRELARSEKTTGGVVRAAAGF